MLDDDSIFLEVTARYITQSLQNQMILTPFSTSQDLISHIQNKCYLPESAQDIAASFYSQKITESRIKQTLQDLAELPAILIVDFELQGENKTGIDVIETIRQSIPCPFVALLTGHVDHHTALSLHNNETIDLFIQKDTLEAMDTLCAHLRKKVATLQTNQALNPEDVFGFGTILEDTLYTTKRSELLNELPYQSYLTLSGQGDIAVLNIDNRINIYQYQNEVFILNE